MEVKGSEAQGRDQPRGWVRKKRGTKARADEQKPDKRRERWTSWQMAAKSISIKGAERKFGGCALKAVELTSGDLRGCHPCPLWSDW
jgi:hypothetical protein